MPRRLALALWTALACTAAPETSAPTRPPASPEPATETPAALTTPEEDEVAREDAEIDAALACAEDRIQDFNDDAEAEDTVLLEAARCYRAAGSAGHAAKVLRAMLDRFPESPNAPIAYELLLETYPLLSDAQGAQRSPLGRRCLASLGTGGVASATWVPLNKAVQCLQRVGLVGAAAALRRDIDAHATLSQGEREANRRMLERLEGSLQQLHAEIERWTADNPPPTPSPAGVHADAPKPPPQPRPEPSPPSSLPTEVPAYATLPYQVQRHTKLRADIRVAGEVFAPTSLTSLSDTVDHRSVLVRVPVLDEDTSGTPRRPRVLCEESSLRVAMAVDVGNLETVVRSETFVSPAPEATRKITRKTPGVRLAAGAPVTRISDPTSDPIEIRHEGLFLSASGFVPAPQVDVVYAPRELADDLIRDGELLRDVSFRDAPGGVELARVDRRGAANTLDVRTLGPARDRHVLVRYQEDDAYVVGWIRDDELKTFKPTKLEFGSGSASGFGSSSNANTIELARGTLLIAPRDGEAIGVVTRAHDFHCGATCSDAYPRVLVHACGHRLLAYAARRPD